MKSRYFYLLPIILLGIWFLITLGDFINPLFISSPQSVFFELLKMIFSGDIFSDLIMTLYRVFSRFLISILIGVPLGLLMGQSEKIYYAMEFLVDFFRSLPSTALFPLFLLIFGIGDATKITIIIFSSSLVILVNTMYGAKNVKKLRILMAKTMKISRFHLFTKIIFPEALPNLFAGLRIAVSFSLIIIIVLEMFVGTTVGLGYRIINAQLLYQTTKLYSLIIFVGIIGYVSNKSLILNRHDQPASLFPD